LTAQPTLAMLARHGKRAPARARRTHRVSRAHSASTVVAACLVCQMGLGLGGYVFAVFLKPIVSELGWSRTAFAGSGGPFLLAMALASPLAGAATERFGARVVFSTAITVVAAALIGFSYMQTLWQFYALGLVLGAAATGLGDIPVGAVVSRAVRDGRGLALGLVYIGSNVGGTIVPLAAASIAEASGWRVALRVLAIGGWLVIFPFARWGIPKTLDGPRDEAAAPGDGLTLADAVRTPVFWTLAWVLFVFYFYYLGVNHHLVAFLSDQGFTNAEAARRFGWAVAVGIAGKLLVGRLADATSVRRTTLATFGLVTLASVLLLGVGRAPGLLPVFLTVHGFAVAAENVVLPLIVGACFGTAHLARIYGALMLVLLPGGVLGPTFAGWMFDVGRGYWVAFAVFAACNVVALAMLARAIAVRSPARRSATAPAP
jgi:MFS family permease